MKKYICSLTVLGSLIPGIIGFHKKIQSREMVTQREERNFTVEGIPDLKLENFDGPISVQSWVKNEVQVIATKSSHTTSDLQGINVSAAQRGPEIILKGDFDEAFRRKRNGATGSVNFAVFVPRQANVQIKTADGALSVTGVTGNIELHTNDGAIKISDSRGKLVAYSDDGKIEINGFDGGAKASLGEGSIYLQGDFSDLEADTGFGSIQLNIPRHANVSIETMAAKVNLLIAGAVEDQIADRRFDRRRWRVGSGGNLFYLKTGRGSITVATS